MATDTAMDFLFSLRRFPKDFSMNKMQEQAFGVKYNLIIILTNHLWELKGWGADLKKAELAIPLYIKSF